MHAYVQIALENANEAEIKDKLKVLPEVRDVHILFGEWDLMAKLEIESPEQLAAFVMENIRSIKGVKLTSTLIVAK
ncbi:Lrp/AsnC ligand binding domain-containing protein [Candidatus Woesearchaeota archaeon]|nr:Lrp/AsnC ligand binding domain-containing protein [Candidatus Woesearchaeota archaeon]